MYDFIIYYYYYILAYVQHSHLKMSNAYFTWIPIDVFDHISLCKGKAVPLQAWSGPEGSRKLRFPDFMITAQDSGKVSLTHQPSLPPRKCSWDSFLLETESTPGP